MSYSVILERPGIAGEFTHTPRISAASPASLTHVSSCLALEGLGTLGKCTCAAGIVAERAVSSISMVYRLISEELASSLVIRRCGACLWARG